MHSIFDKSNFLSNLLKYRRGVGAIRMATGVLGATLGSYAAAKNTTDKYIVSFRSLIISKSCVY